MLFPLVTLIVCKQIVTYGFSIDNAKVVGVKGADRIVIFTSYSNAKNRAATRTATLQVEGVRSPRPGERGFAESLRWAKAHFKKGMELSGGVARPDFRNGAFVVIGFPKGVGLDEYILREGYGVYDPRQMDKHVRDGMTATQVADYKAMYKGDQIEAMRARKGLWGTVWKNRVAKH